MAMVTFGGAYAVLAYVAQQAVETYGWLQPGEMLDGLGMAETTPGPLIMVLQFVGFMAAFRDPGALHPLSGRHAGRPSRHMGDLRALLPLDLPRRALHRDPARQPRLERRLVRHHGRRRGRDPEPRDLVRHPHDLQGCSPHRMGIFNFDAPVWESVELWALLLSATAIVAMFRFKIGMLPTLAATSAAGIALYATGAIA